jgi:hypothetical protein
MSPFVRMQLRMLVPCLLPLPIGVILAWIVALVEGVPLHLDLRVEPAMAPQMIFFGSVLIATLCSGFQTWRLWRWMRGSAEVCAGCGRLLGASHDQHTGMSHRCLECSRRRCIE